MINTARKRFILTTMSILLAVFVAIYFISYAIITYIFNFTVNKQLQDTVISYELSKKDLENYVPAKGLIVLIAKNGSVISSPNYDTDYFNEESVKTVINLAVERNHMTGNVGEYYYMFSNINSDYYIFVSVNAKESLAVRKNSRINSLIFIATIYVILLLIVLKISERVFKPIKENLAKQRQFLADASHELKTPLTIISANAEVLSESQNNQWLDNIKTQTQRMEELVSDMLTLTKNESETKDIIPENFNISQEITDVVLPFDAVAFEQKKTIITEISPNVTYYGDRQGIIKIVNILLDNAIKYGKENGEILVSLVKNGNNVFLTVKNDGSNVKDEDSNKIFERFYRAEGSRSRGLGGSGLGLAIAKSICDKNKWKIFAISKYNESMQITVII